MNCPVCGSKACARLVTRTGVPIFQNAVYTSAAAASTARAGDLAFDACAGCGFVFNSAFDARAIDYDAAYDNSQVHSKAFLEHLSTRIDRILNAAATDGPLTVVEIGCGQGDFLARLSAAVPPERPFRAVGFDPAYRGGGLLPAGVEIHPAYFDAGAARRLDVAPDIVISRHTIEHVPDPVQFLGAIHQAVGDIGERATRLFLETPDSAWILRNDAFHDFFYEHCSLFDFTSMAAALDRSGWQPSRIETCFDGQYLWVEAAPVPDAAAAGRFAVRAGDYQQRWLEVLRAARRCGRVALWGAGAKGATFALMMDPDGDLIDAVVDRNPGKSGAFIAVSAHPVIAPEALLGRGVATVVIMNPNYEQEIRQQLAELGLSPTIVVLR